MSRAPCHLHWEPGDRRAVCGQKGGEPHMWARWSPHVDVDLCPDCAAGWADRGCAGCGHGESRHVGRLLDGSGVRVGWGCADCGCPEWRQGGDPQVTDQGAEARKGGGS